MPLSDEFRAGRELLSAAIEALVDRELVDELGHRIPENFVRAAVVAQDEQAEKRLFEALDYIESTIVLDRWQSLRTEVR